MARPVRLSGRRKPTKPPEWSSTDGQVAVLRCSSLPAIGVPAPTPKQLKLNVPRELQVRSQHRCKRTITTR
eukprot:1432816-Amphidinium_carterae.1